MRYTTGANVINWAFIGLIFFGPSAYCLTHIDVPFETGRDVIMLSAVLGIFVLMDWYHLHMSNSILGAVSWCCVGSAIAVVCVLAASILSGNGILDMALFRAPDAWDGSGLLLKFYVVGMGMASAAGVSIPRLALIALTCKSLYTEEWLDA